MHSKSPPTAYGHVPKDCYMASTLGKSDHIGILWNITLSHNIYTTATKKLWHKFSPQEIVNIAQELEWSTSGDSQEMWDSIHTNLQKVCDAVPKKNINAHSGNFENKSSSPAVIRALKKSTKMWNLFDINPTAINHALANDSDINLNRKILETLTATEKKVIKNLRTQPKPFYAHLNRKKLTKAAITSIKSVTSSEILRDPDRIAE